MDRNLDNFYLALAVRFHAEDKMKDDDCTSQTCLVIDCRRFTVVWRLGSGTRHRKIMVFHSDADFCFWIHSESNDSGKVVN